MRGFFAGIVMLVLLAVPAYADNSGLLTFDAFLASRSLSHGDVKCINPQTEDVLNTVIQDWDRSQTVCAVWINEKVTAAQPLTFKDGAQVYMTVRRWMAPEPRQVERSDEFVVREDSKQEAQTRAFKRYVAQ